MANLDVDVKALEPEQLRDDALEVNRKIEQHHQVGVDQSWYKPDKSDQCAFIQEYYEERDKEAEVQVCANLPTPVQRRDRSDTSEEVLRKTAVDAVTNEGEKR